MRIQMLSVLGVLIGAALLGEPGAWARPLPSGSYQATCSDMHLARGVLTATCRTMDQRLLRSELRSVASCVGDIANIDGQLACSRRGVPGGSYLETCTGAVMHDDTLTASCRTIDSRWVDTWLGAISECEGDIANLDGKLSCSR